MELTILIYSVGALAAALLVSITASHGERKRREAAYDALLSRWVSTETELSGWRRTAQTLENSAGKTNDVLEVVLAFASAGAQVEDGSTETFLQVAQRRGLALEKIVNLVLDERDRLEAEK